MNYAEKMIKEAGKTPFKLEIVGKKAEGEIKGIKTSVNFVGSNTEAVFAYAAAMKLLQEQMFLSSVQILELTKEILIHYKEEFKF